MANVTIELPQSWLCQEIDGTIRHGGPLPGAVLAGSFNPLHHGHRRIAEAAENVLRFPVAFEISVANVDKPELSAEELRQRVQQFVGLAPVYVTRAPTFVAKARLFPQSVLVVGIDTAVRIIDPRYYGNDPQARDEALALIRECGCRFLVAPRKYANGVVEQWDGAALSERHRPIFEAMPAEFEAVNVSSTEIRKRGL